VEEFLEGVEGIAAADRFVAVDERSGQLLFRKVKLDTLSPG
jgi:hypothetical protein